MGGASGASRLSGIYFILKNANKNFAKDTKTHIKACEKLQNIYKDVEPCGEDETQAGNNGMRPPPGKIR